MAQNPRAESLRNVDIGKRRKGKDMTRQMISRIAVVAFMASLACGGAHAQMFNPSPVEVDKTLFEPTAVAPDVNDVPILKNIVTGGAKLYFLGERSGMPGWFIVKNGQVQMIYLSPDHKTALIGGMFTDEGDNVTGAQVKALSQADKGVYQMLNGPSQQQSKISSVGAVNGGVAVVPSSPILAGTGKTDSSALPSATLSPGDRLYEDLEAAAGVVLGKSDAPEIQIVVAPNCPNCKSTWRELRDAVKAGQISVRLVPVYNSLGGEEANIAAQLLRAKDPYEEWDKHVNGDKAALSGKPDEIAMKAVVANLTLVSKWNIKGYPYLVYRSKEGKIKIVQGRPERMAAVLLDMTR